MATDDSQRFARHVALPQIGSAGQQRLLEARALIVGLGGLGSSAALYLANSGVGQLTVNDFDRVDATNLPRQILFTSDDIGQLKADVAGEQLRRRNPGLEITVVNRRFDDAALLEAVGQSDIVLDCSDNFATRSALNNAAYATATPLVSGAAIRFEGQLTIFRHDRRESPAPCYRCLYSTADEALDDCRGQGILAPVVGTIGCMMATEAIKCLAGLESSLDGKLWVYDAAAGDCRTLRIRKDPNCPVCGGVRPSGDGSNNNGV